MTRTGTLAELVLSRAAYDEIKRSFEAAGYQHAIGGDDMLDMTGIGVTRLARPTGIQVMERTTVTHEDGTTTTRVRRIQALGAAISRRDWSGVESAHAAIRDAQEQP